MANFGPVGLNPVYITKTATTVSTSPPAFIGGKGASVALNNPTPCNITSVGGIYISTATVGSRVITLMVVDSNNNLVLATGFGGGAPAITAGLTVLISAGGAVTPFGPTNTVVYCATLPVGFIVPPFSTIFLVDRAQVDAADTMTFEVMYLV